MKRAGLAAVLLCLLLSGCAVAPETESVSFFAMDTLMSVQAAGENASAALQAAEARVNELERMFSVTRPESELAQLNAAGSLTVSEDTAALLERALAFGKLTDGRFDITVSPAVDAWGFYTDDYRVPDASELSALRERIDFRRVALEGCRVVLGKGQRLDLGGIAKGYASEEICRILRQEGVESGLIVLGGSVQTLGARPDGSLWRIGIQHPDGSGYLGVWTGRDCAVVTSGDYRRYFEQDGKRCHHLLDPRTAAPAESDLRSVTVICADCVKADALSTALFVMGREAALGFRRAQEDFELILYTADGRLIVSSGLAHSFETDYPMEVAE